MVWRKILPQAFPGDRRATLDRLDSFFEAASPHLSEFLETYTYEVENLVKRRAVAIDAKTFAAHDVVAVLLDSGGRVRGCFTYDGLRNRPPGARDLAGRMLVMDARLGGLDANGLLDPKTAQPPPTFDEDVQWTLTAEEVGFRVRVVDPDSRADRGWHIQFCCPAFAADEDGNGGEIRVEVYRGRSDAAGDLAIARNAQTLADHTEYIVREARKIASELSLPPELGRTLEVAARQHDRGKARVLWQRAMNAPKDGGPCAKTTGGGNPRLLLLGEAAYRHEFGSLRDAEIDSELDALPPDLRDLALHLIAAHHGFARPVIAAVDPDEPPSKSSARAQEAALRYARLQKRWGWWGLAWWEALIRAADWAASAKNDAAERDDG